MSSRVPKLATKMYQAAVDAIASMRNPENRQHVWNYLLTRNKKMKKKVEEAGLVNEEMLKSSTEELAK